MCLAIPGKIIEIFESNGMTMGHIDYSGAKQTVCLAYVEDASIGQYVVVHAGFAISVLNEEEAENSLQLWDEMIEKSSQNDDYRLEWDNTQLN